MANIGTLNVDLTATTANFTANLTKAKADLASSATQMNTSLAKMEKSFESVKDGALEMGRGLLTAKGGFGALFEVVGVGLLAEFVHKTIETASAMVDMADRIGISTDALQELSYAGKLAGLSSEDLERNLTRLNRTIADTGAGNKTILTQLGIQARDSAGNYRPLLDVMYELADRYQKAGSSAAKTKILVEAFGKSGSQMAPLFKEGAEGIKEAVEEAQRLGIVIDSNLLRGAKSADDAMVRLGATLNASVTRSVLILAPVIESLADFMTRAAAALRDFSDTAADFFGDAQAASFEYLKSEIDSSMWRLNAFQNAAKALKDVPGVNWIAQGMADYEQGHLSYLQQAQEDKLELQNFDAGKPKSKSSAGEADQFSTGNRDQLADYIASLREEVQLAQTDGEAHDVLAAMLKAEKIARDQNVKLSDAQKQTIKGYVQLIDEYNEKSKEKKRLEQEGKQLTESLLTPQEKYNADIAEYNKLLAAGAITQDTYNRAVAAAKKTLDESSDSYKQAGELAGDLKDALGNAWDEAYSGGKKVTDIVAELIQALAQAIVKVYILGPLLKQLGDIFQNSFGSGGGSGGGLGGIFGWIGNGISSIFGSGSGAATPPSGTGPVGGFAFATGGSGVVGGVGPIDSKLVSLRLTPGELVNVTRPGAAQGGSPVNVIINNNADGTKATATERTDALGQTEIIVQIEQEMAKRVAKTGSPLNKAITQTFNSKQNLASR